MHARRCSRPIQVVLRKERDGEWVAIESAIRVLALLNEVASVFLVSMVGSDLDESLVKDVALSSGLTCPSSTNASKASAAPAAPAPTPTGIPEHRLLFCSSHIGQVAVVRQLAPSLHIGGAVALLEGVSRFVPSLVRIDASAVEPPPESAALPPAEAEKAVANSSSSSSSSARGVGYSLEWREFKTLAAAAGLTLPVAGSSVRSGSSAAESRVDASAADGRDSTVAEGGGLGEDEAEELGAPPNASTLSKGDEKGVGQSYGALPSSPPYSPTLS
ncbi:unnamed protein product [Hapterophycus canaliculatus]